MNDDIIENETGKENAITTKWSDPNGYMVRCGRHYKAKVIDRGEYKMYKLIVSQKDRDGKYEYTDKTVKFKDGGGESIKDGDIVEPISFYERWYYSDKFDPNHYNPIFYLVIKEWKILKPREELQNEAYKEYNVSIEMDDVPF